VAVLNGFYFRYGAGFQERKDRVPIVRCSISQTQRDAVVWRCCRLASQCAWRTVKQLLKRLIEPANASKSCCQCNLGHRHARFMNELFREENSSRLSYRYRRRSQMLEEQPSQLTFPYAEAVCKSLYTCAVAIERSFRDECQGSRDSIGCATPGGHVRCGVEDA